MKLSLLKLCEADDDKTKVVEKHKDLDNDPTKIVARMSKDKLMNKMNNSKNIIEALGGATIQNYIAKGAYGYTYKLTNGKVLKLTGDINEAETSRDLIKAYNLHIVNIYDVFRIKLKDGKLIYAIIEEFLDVNETKNTDMFQQLATALTKEINDEYNYFEAIDVVDEYINEEEYELLKYRVKSLVEKYNLNKEIIKFIDDLISAFKFLATKGIKWGDLHSGNIGLRGGNYVIFDFGKSKSERQAGNIDKEIAEAFNCMVREYTE